MDRVQHQLIALVLFAGCGGDAGARDAGTVVDSLPPRDVALAQFRAGLPEVTGFSGGAPTRDALVREFVRALTSADTAALRQLTLSRAEFGWLYYPSTPQGLPPYDLSPGLLWTMLALHGERGLRHALEGFGGRPARYLAHNCDARVSREGANTVYGPCVVRLALAADTVERRLVGLIVNRGGRFKFVSLANKLH
jgi:hypothetical protein